ncbi:hypothetical protein, partial [Bradyrhizobium sp.]|uniref:hypothetical protein n=1 Tax=Bradyrhizobium sp. TaxID=376 RepID=UPI0025B8872B
SVRPRSEMVASRSEKKALAMFLKSNPQNGTGIPYIRFMAEPVTIKRAKSRQRGLRAAAASRLP